MPLKKQYVQVEIEGKPVFVSIVSEGDSKSYLDAKKDAQKNLEHLFYIYQEDKKQLESRIAYLEEEIRKIKGED